MVLTSASIRVNQNVILFNKTIKNIISNYLIMIQSLVTIGIPPELIET